MYRVILGRGKDLEVKKKIQPLTKYKYYFCAFNEADGPFRSALLLQRSTGVLTGPALTRKRPALEEDWPKQDRPAQEIQSAQRDRCPWSSRRFFLKARNFQTTVFWVSPISLFGRSSGNARLINARLCIENKT